MRTKSSSRHTLLPKKPPTSSQKIKTPTWSTRKTPISITATAVSRRSIRWNLDLNFTQQWKKKNSRPKTPWRRSSRSGWWTRGRRRAPVRRRKHIRRSNRARGASARSSRQSRSGENYTSPNAATSPTRPRWSASPRRASMTIS